MDKTESDKGMIYLAIGWFSGMSLGMAVGKVAYEWKMSSRIIPETTVQQGYVQPSQLEIDVKDIDNNGKKETVLKYDNKRYLFQLDIKGKPTLFEYVVKPEQTMAQRR